ncbi:MAG: DEAD/DEAH box helicase [Acidimicrobiia bacterium]|nr:DEAD/DEAH box helicase [Acidimicrobiia bacterium]
MTIEAGLPFRPDQFQLDAAAQIDEAMSVVVVAPTGAGKTLIAEHAVARAYRAGERSFYTTPIKALSNQKYADFRSVYGDAVGLLTGDNVINGDAPIVVMTTEVLRNMIYADSPALGNLGVVILDEVHYLQNRYRGSVWEEIIIHLPRPIAIVSLSATIANPEEFTNWVRSRRGDTALIVETHRPVPLQSMYLVKDRYREGALNLLPVFAGTRPNPQVSNLLKKGRGRYRRFAVPRRIEVAELLSHEGLLPAIYFIFSRTGCDQAAAAVAESGLGLTTSTERQEIRARVDRLIDHLPPQDLGALGFETWLSRLEHGVAAHHAGMVPAFKEAVEDLFAAGLVKLVFATETLSLGINMPARSVVLERLSKFDGESHAILQPGDYTQLTGRAGRRGIDTLGTALVLHNFDIPFERVAGIAAEGSHPLTSSFSPTYNMAANLVANYAQREAEELLNASFAQFRASERRANLRSALSERVEEADEFRTQAKCQRGDIWAYLEKEGDAFLERHQAMRDFVQQFREGDVLRLTAEPADVAVLLARGWGANPRMVLVRADGAMLRISADDLDSAVAVVGQMTLPEPVRTRDGGYRKSVARLLRSWSPGRGFEEVRFVAAGTEGVAGCPDLMSHLDWIKRLRRAESEIRRLRGRLDRSEEGLVSTFRALLGLLEAWGYVDGWLLTAKGEQLRFVYNELDLLLTESVDRGLLDDLSAAELAAVASLFTYESRRLESENGLASGVIAQRAGEIEELALELTAAERAARVPETRLPERGFAATAHAWAAGHDLEDLFDDDMAAGDFVRNCRQLIDVLRQLRDEFPRLKRTAAEAVRRMDRGVVAAGGRA